jgi:hypothetical protein
MADLLRLTTSLAVATVANGRVRDQLSASYELLATLQTARRQDLLEFKHDEAI